MKFRGTYGFLSNFYKCRVFYDNIEFDSVEFAFQYAKADTAEGKSLILCARDARAAKHYAPTVRLRKDWQKVKVSIMEDLLRQKFDDPSLRKRLSLTGNLEIVEDNTWGDTFWVRCHGSGENVLGNLLMKIRSEIRGVC